MLDCTLYRCLDRKQFFPPEHPRVCHQPPGVEQALICCNFADMCNADLKPKLAVVDPSVDDSNTIDSGPGKHSVTPILCR